MSLVLHTPFDLQHLIAIIVDPIKANDILDRRQTITREYSSFLFSVMALVYLLDKDGTYIHCHASCGRQLGLGGVCEHSLFNFPHSYTIYFLTFSFPRVFYTKNPSFCCSRLGLGKPLCQRRPLVLCSGCSSFLFTV